MGATTNHRMANAFSAGKVEYYRGFKKGKGFNHFVGMISINMPLDWISERG